MYCLRVILSAALIGGGVSSAFAADKPAWEVGQVCEYDLRDRSVQTVVVETVRSVSPDGEAMIEMWRPIQNATSRVWRDRLGNISGMTGPDGNKYAFESPLERYRSSMKAGDRWSLKYSFPFKGGEFLRSGTKTVAMAMHVVGTEAVVVGGQSLQAIHVEAKGKYLNKLANGDEKEGAYNEDFWYSTEPTSCPILKYTQESRDHEGKVYSLQTKNLMIRPEVVSYSGKPY